MSPPQTQKDVINFYLARFDLKHEGPWTALEFMAYAGMEKTPQNKQLANEAFHKLEAQNKIKKLRPNLFIATILFERLGGNSERILANYDLSNREVTEDPSANIEQQTDDFSATQKTPVASASKQSSSNRKQPNPSSSTQDLHLIESGLHFIEAQEAAFSREDFSNATGMTGADSTRFLNDQRNQGKVEKLRPGIGRRPSIWASVEVIKRLQSTHNSEEDIIAQLLYDYSQRGIYFANFRLQLMDFVFTQTRGFSQRYLYNSLAPIGPFAPQNHNRFTSKQEYIFNSVWNDLLNREKITELGDIEGDSVYIPTLVIEERQKTDNITIAEAEAELLKEYSDPTETLFAFAYPFSDKKVTDSNKQAFREAMESYDELAEAFLLLTESLNRGELEILQTDAIVLIEKTIMFKEGIPSAEVNSHLLISSAQIIDTIYAIILDGRTAISHELDTMFEELQNARDLP